MMALGHLTGNYKSLGEWNKLIELCDYMLELKKDDPAWLTQSHGGYTKYAAKGLAYHNLMKEMANEAIFNYNKVIELKPSAGAYRDLGMVYRDIGESEKAKEAFEKAIEMYSTTIEEGTYTRMYRIYYSRGLTYYEMREYDEAISDFNKTIELKSDYANAYRDLGKAYVAIGDTANATEAFETAVRLFEEQGNSDAAEQVRQLLEELPTVGASALPTLITEYTTVPEDVCPIMLEQGLEETAKEI
jgi:tetratricopeptide (TPR) repeat protein